MPGKVVVEKGAPPETGKRAYLPTRARERGPREGILGGYPWIEGAPGVGWGRPWRTDGPGIDGEGDGTLMRLGLMDRWAPFRIGCQQISVSSFPAGAARFSCPPDYTATPPASEPRFSLEELSGPDTQLWLIQAPADFAPEW